MCFGAGSSRRSRQAYTWIWICARCVRYACCDRSNLSPAYRVSSASVKQTAEKEKKRTHVSMKQDLALRSRERNIVERGFRQGNTARESPEKRPRLVAINDGPLTGSVDAQTRSSRAKVARSPANCLSAKHNSAPAFIPSNAPPALKSASQFHVAHNTCVSSCVSSCVSRRTLSRRTDEPVSRVFSLGAGFFWDAVKDGGAAQRCDYGLEKRAWLDDCTFSAECRSSLYHLFCLFLRS